MRNLNKEMKHNLRNLKFTVWAVLLLGQVLWAAPVAFPGAEGFGAYAKGGRGGDVYTVTNIEDSGPGSLREGIRSAKGPRTIVFAVSGLIQLKSKLIVNSDYLTIAGQTAPGDGICLRNYTFEIKANHVIVRYMRSRLGDTAGQVADAISITAGHNIIVDHCSASWSVDEVLSCQSGEVDMLTVQWCMVSESLRDSIHPKGPHGYGGIIGSLRQSFHHNLFAHHSSRNPKITGRRHCEVDFRNNVIFNWGFNSCYDATASHVNWVNNYYRAGPATKTGVGNRIFQLSDNDIESGRVNRPEDSLAYETSFFAEGNYVYGHEAVTADNWSGGIDLEDGATEAVNRARVAFDFPAIREQTAEEAYPLVLAGAGASFARDRIDSRIAYEVSVGEARLGEKGLINTPEDVGGWPRYRMTVAPKDTDQDGMPDRWETERGLNFNKPSDRNGFELSKIYTNLEVYLNGIVDEADPR
jgi:pectate lyase